MILKKPYAFFIKYFKLIHFIMLIFLCLIFFRFSVIRDFFSNYLSEIPVTISKGTAESILPVSTYIWFAITILGSSIILVVMNKKEKPAVFYAVNILLNIVVLVFLIYSRTMIFRLETELLDQRILRGIRDISNILAIIQIIILLMTLVRTIGFDIKKFNFVKDLQELDIDVKDNEEFEVALEFDPNDVKRRWKKYIREFKYFLKENLRMVILVCLVFVVSVFLFIYLNFWKFSKTYKMKSYFNAPGISLMVNDSYITKKGYNLNNISEDNELLIVSLNLKDSTDILNTSKTILKIGEKDYYPVSSKYNSKLIDIGTVYGNQTLTKEESKYLLVYEIPEDIKNKKIVFTYLGNSSRTLFGEKYEELYVNLTPIDLDIETKVVSSSLENNLIFDSVLISGNLFINNYEINNTFINPYNFCITKTECVDFNEYLQPSFTGYQDKTILRMNYTLSYKEASVIRYKIQELINKFGKISYVIDNKTYETKDITATNFKYNKKSSNVYLEIPKVVETAKKIELVLRIRSTEYRYVLREG